LARFKGLAGLGSFQKLSGRVSEKGLLVHTKGAAGPYNFTSSKSQFNFVSCQNLPSLGNRPKKMPISLEDGKCVKHVGIGHDDTKIQLPVYNIS